MVSAPGNRNSLISPSYQDTAKAETPPQGVKKYGRFEFNNETPASIKPRYIRNKPLSRKVRALKPVLPEHQLTQSPSERTPKKIKIPADKVQSIQETLLPVNPDVAAITANHEADKVISLLTANHDPRLFSPSQSRRNISPDLSKNSPSSLPQPKNEPIRAFTPAVELEPLSVDCQSHDFPDMIDDGNKA